MPTWGISAARRSAFRGLRSSIPASCSITWARARCCSATPAAVENPFYLMAPEWARLPLVFLATAATIIASQAVISGAFSVTHQAVQLGFLPRLAHRAHQRQGGRPNLHPGRQLGAAGHGHPAGPRLPPIDQPRLGLRHRRQRHDDHHHDHARRADLPGMEMEPLAGGTHDRPCSRWWTAASSPRTSPRLRTAAGSRWSSRRSSSPC